MRLAGTMRLLGGRNLPVSLPVRKDWWWADGGARGHGHGLGPIGRRVRLCKIEVSGIGMMHPREVLLGRSCGSVVLNFHVLHFANHRAMLFL